MGFYVVAILVLLFTFRDGTITLSETSIYLISYGMYIYILIKWKKWFPEKESLDKTKLVPLEIQKEDTYLEKKGMVYSQFVLIIDKALSFIFPDLDKRPQLYWLTFTISIVAIIALSWALVETAVLFAHTVGIPEVIIALTILAGGTSVPDLLASLIVAKKGRGDMAVSNAVDSNTFDILICLGLPWFVYILFTRQNMVVATENLISSILLLFFTVIAIFFVLAVQKFKIGRKAGYFLIILYAVYLLYVIGGVYF